LIFSMNRLRNLFAAASLLVLMSPPWAAGPPVAAFEHPLLGSWTWVTFGGSCTETLRFQANRRVLGTSGEEVTEKQYEVAATPDARGFYRLQETVIRQNDKKDCSGVMAEGPGEQSTRFIQFSPQGDQMLVCQSAALTACFGPLKRLP
jgi:hypothetical protein